MADDRNAQITLYTVTPSSCAKRVQLALEIKGLTYEKVVLDPTNFTPEILKLNPRKQVPVLVVDGHVITQSLAIIEYLEERWPTLTPLLPKDLLERSKVREIANAVVSGIQPLQNSGGPLPKLLGEKLVGMSFLEWKIFWVDHGFTALEKQLETTAGTYCVGNNITLADLCLVPQYINARDSFKMDMSKYPTIQKIAENCLSLDSFKTVCLPTVH